MEALTAVGLTPISVLSEPRKVLSPPTTFSLKSSISSNFTPNLSHFSPNFQKGLVLFSSILSTGIARALTYEEAIQQSPGKSSPSLGTAEFDVGGFVDGIVSFGTENPVVVAGGAALIALPIVLSQVLGKDKSWGVESAKSAYAKLGDDATAQLLDIRAPAEIRQAGSPDIRGLKKKPVPVAYRVQDKEGFLKKLSLRFKDPQNTTLLILDKFDGNSKLAAELVTANGFKAAYAIKDGAEGPRGWMNSGLPWILPKKTLSLDLGNLTEAFADGSDALPVTLGIAAAAAGLGLLAFTEVETILQIVGSAALIQIISNKLLFAEDRKQTLEQVDEFLNTKVAPKELVDEIKEIGKALLPSPVNGKALPAPAEASAVATESPPPKAEAAVLKPAPQINAVPKTEVKAESLPGMPRPLSPYSAYPDLKPPTSPSPSQP
ncbi:hypothetical protein NMG60_11028939 [Bertholletia excelsa]